ncbi:Ribonuclease TUDOR 1 [Camellia lanceoleosa]|uniref:Ribonuclease TUDOR 1 n=1 Tax=Camellia lanceoleosa TaxID=1840588 RepID=A0ACC0GWL2_9ERIC|nr:Ribonuclease TUDOR 1 [Camellia lanceoleosa]
MISICVYVIGYLIVRFPNPNGGNGNSKIVYVIFAKSYAFNLWRGKGLREVISTNNGFIFLLASRAVVLATALLVSLSLHLETIHEATFTVGDSLGWDFSVGSWTNGKQFKAEDMLICVYMYAHICFIKLDYTVPSIGREFGSVFLGDKNVALMVVSDGWVKVREQGQQKGDASPFLAELLRLEEQAKQQGLGRWTMLFSVVIFQLLLLVPFAFANANGLKLGFYHKTCQSIEAIVKETTARFISRALTLAAPLIRMHFHDYFVKVGSAFTLLFNAKVETFLMWWEVHTQLVGYPMP